MPQASRAVMIAYEAAIAEATLGPIIRTTLRGATGSAKNSSHARWQMYGHTADAGALLESICADCRA